MSKSRSKPKSQPDPDAEAVRRMLEAAGVSDAAGALRFQAEFGGGPREAPSVTEGWCHGCGATVYSVSHHGSSILADHYRIEGDQLVVLVHKCEQKRN